MAAGTRKRDISKLLPTGVPERQPQGHDAETLMALRPPNPAIVSRQQNRQWWAWACNTVMPSLIGGHPDQVSRAQKLRWQRLADLEAWWRTVSLVAERDPSDEQAQQLFAHKQRAAAWLLAEWRSRTSATQWVSRRHLAFSVEVRDALDKTR